jgi:hypothetical protein
MLLQIRDFESGLLLANSVVVNCFVEALTNSLAKRVTLQLRRVVVLLDLRAL